MFDRGIACDKGIVAGDEFMRVFIHFVCTRDTGAMGVVGIELGVRHAQGLEETFLQKLFVFHAGNDFQNATGNRGAEAVLVAAAGFEGEWRF